MYQISDYDNKYKPTNSKGGELVTAVYVKLPVKPRGKGLKALLKRQGGTVAYAVWCLLLQAATELKPQYRGKLLNYKDEPATIEEIAEAISFDGREKEVEESLSILKSMGWIGYVQGTEEVRTNYVQGTEDVPPKISKDKIREVEDKGYDCDSEPLSDIGLTTTRLINMWDSFAKHKASGFFNLIQIEVSRLILSNGISEQQISNGIKNYQKALQVPNSQAHDHMMAKWLSKNFMESYIDGKFNIENYDSSRFEKKGTGKIEPPKKVCWYCKQPTDKPFKNKYMCDTCRGYLKGQQFTTHNGKVISNERLDFGQLEIMIEQGKAKRG